MSLYDELEEMFADRGYLWKIAGGYTQPTTEDIEAVVTRSVEELKSHPAGAMLEIGRLIIQRNARNKYDVYMHVGETG